LGYAKPQSPTALCGFRSTKVLLLRGIACAIPFIAKAKPSSYLKTLGASFLRYENIEIIHNMN